MGQSDQTYTDFGFEQVPVGEKSDRVRAVFDRVAGQYDAMNDCLYILVPKHSKYLILTILI